MKRIVFLLGTSFLLFTSCDGIEGSGHVVSQERMAAGFQDLSVNGVANVQVQIGERYKVEVTTDDNLQDYVFVEVKNNVLHIDTKSEVHLRPTKLIIDVCMPALQSINLQGVGNVKLLNGNASDLAISLSGVGNIDAQNYQVQNVSINHSGVGKATIWATSSLNGTLSGVGSIQYKGDPEVHVQVSGIGKVNRL